MRLGVTFDDQPVNGEKAQLIEDRLRWALGSFVCEVLAVRFLTRTRGDNAACEAVITMRNGEVVKVTGDGRRWEEVVDFVSSRAGAAVARRFQLNRMLKG